MTCLRQTIRRGRELWPHSRYLRHAWIRLHLRRDFAPKCAVFGPSDKGVLSARSA